MACGATLNCLLVPYMPLAFTISWLTLAASGERGHLCRCEAPQHARLRSTETAAATRSCAGAVHKELSGAALLLPLAAPATRAMKIKSAVKRLCEHCYMVRRGKTLYVRCTKNPRHKQRQGFATDARAGPPPPRAWISPLTRGDPAVAPVDHAAPVDDAALLERLFARVK